ncbi:MAG TPA: hypothetical protein VN025_11275 [Candidatus Dormibacteraeota bacterium]|jgi:hypothetical protein|nr:hypothetical protein [Candidatus Dormibacteraeota bacterium]
MSYCTEKFPDDLSIEAEESLLRRIPPDHIIFDDNEKRWRPSSAAFEDDRDGDPMSVVLLKILNRDKREPSSVLKGHEDYALASITAGLARQYVQTVHPQPLDEEPAHAVVCGEKTKGKKNAPKKKFAQAATWVVFEERPHPT